MEIRSWRSRASRTRAGGGAEATDDRASTPPLPTPVFVGKSTQRLDDKRRVSVPARLRDALRSESEGFFLARGLGGCIWLCTEAQWREVERKMFKAAEGDGPGSRKVRDFKRAFYMSATHCVPDKQGRILLTEELVSIAEIDRDVVFVGYDDKVEIWSADRAREFQEQFSGDAFDRMGEEIFEQQEKQKGDGAA